MTTYLQQMHPSGNLVDADNIKPGDVPFEDVARALALTNRFSGSTAFPYSVAAHSLAVMDILERDGADHNTCLMALLHDAEEAVFGDIPRPSKTDLPSSLRAKMADARFAIMEGLGVRNPNPNGYPYQLIKQADQWCLFAERWVLQPNTGGVAWVGHDDKPPLWIAEALRVSPPATYDDVPTVPRVREEPWRYVESLFTNAYHYHLRENER